MGILTGQNPDTPEGHEHSSKLEPRNPVGPRRIPEEPCHSPNKAMPSYHPKKQSFGSGITNMWHVCVDFHREGLFLGQWGSSTDLVEEVTRHVVSGWPSHMAGQLMSSSSTDFLHCHSVSLLV
jgi:hypothetical protein